MYPWLTHSLTKMAQKCFIDAVQRATTPWDLHVNFIFISWIAASRVRHPCGTVGGCSQTVSDNILKHSFAAIFNPVIVLSWLVPLSKCAAAWYNYKSQSQSALEHFINRLRRIPATANVWFPWQTVIARSHLSVIINKQSPCVNCKFCSVDFCVVFVSSAGPIFFFLLSTCLSTSNSAYCFWVFSVAVSVLRPPIFCLKALNVYTTTVAFRIGQQN